MNRFTWIHNIIGWWIDLPKPFTYDYYLLIDSFKLKREKLCYFWNRIGKLLVQIKW